MDINIKGNIDGIETAEQILKQFNIPSVYLTAYADKNTLSRAKLTAPFGYIVKPFEETNLYTTIEIALNKHQEEQLFHRSISDTLIDLPNRKKFLEQLQHTLTKFKQENNDDFSVAIDAYLKQYSFEETFTNSEDTKISAEELDRILNYIGSRLSEKISLEDLADRLGISKYYFCHIFKQSLGTSPHQYLIQKRIEKAKKLLELVEDSLADIAYQCGFNSQSHFSRHFKQKTGLTPKKYQTLRSSKL